MTQKEKDIYLYFVKAVIEDAKSENKTLPSLISSDFRILDSVMEYYKWYTIYSNIDKLKKILKIKMVGNKSSNPFDFNQEIEVLYDIEIIVNFFMIFSKIEYSLRKELNFKNTKIWKDLYGHMDFEECPFNMSIKKFIKEITQVNKDISLLDTLRNQIKHNTNLEIKRETSRLIKLNHFLNNANKYSSISKYKDLTKSFFECEKIFIESIESLINIFDLNDDFKLDNFLESQLGPFLKNRKTKMDRKTKILNLKEEYLTFEEIRKLYNPIKDKINMSTHFIDLIENEKGNKNKVFSKLQFSHALEIFIKEEFFYDIFQYVNTYNQETVVTSYLFFSSWIYKQLHAKNPLEKRNIYFKPSFEFDVSDYNHKENGIKKILPLGKMIQDSEEFWKINKATLQRYCITKYGSYQRNYQFIKDILQHM